MKFVLFLISVTLLISLISTRGLREVFTWTRINYVHLQQEQQQQQQRPIRQSSYRKNAYLSVKDKITFPGATNGDRTPTRQSPNSDYIYENNIPMGANVWRNRLFITVPRRRLGVPSTLNYVPLDTPTHHNVPLIPYPNLEINSLNSSNRIVSVYRVAVDPCDRLWFIDTGVIELPENRTQIQPTQLVIINLENDQIIRRSIIDDDLLRPSTNLASVTLDTTPDTCRTGDIFAYIPDLGGYGLIVYSYKENRFWRVQHNYFYLEPLAGEFRIAGHRFQWNDGIFSIALSYLNVDGYRDAYFHSMAGTHLYRVSTRILRNRTLATRSFHGDDFEIVGDRGALSQSSASTIYQDTGVLFFGLVNQNALGCWNIYTNLSEISIVHKDDTKMIYPSDVKIGDDNKIYMLTNTMPGFLYGQLNYDEINFRVWIQNVEKAIEGTKCARP